MKKASILGLSLLLFGCGDLTGSPSLPSQGESAITNNDKDDAAQQTKPLPETEKPAAGEIQTLYIKPELSVCSGVGLRTCLQTRTDQSQDWSLFYASIDGFEFEPGYHYQLRVQVTPVKKPPADGSSLAYKLLEVVSKEAVAAQPLRNTHWVYTGSVINQRAIPVLADSTITLDFSDSEASGSAGCNRFFGGYSQTGQQLSFKTLASTKMACLDAELSQQEGVFLSHLGEVARLSLDSQTLTLYLANNDHLRFEAAE